MATTPPPASPRELRVPRAPRHGAGYDSFDPYPTRQSARLAGQRTSDRHTTTPPPSSPKKFTRHNDVDTLSPPNTLSPRKKTVRGKALLISEVLDSETSDLSDGAGGLSSRSSIVPGRPQLLPTPVKTPHHQKPGKFGYTARSLFTPTKSAKKPSGYSLDSFQEDPTGNHSSIEIYTDSRDRIPVKNDSIDNPFASKSEIKMSSDRETSQFKRRDLAPELDSKEMVERTDGMLYTFRGKKIFRKFEQRDSDDEEDETEADELGLFANRPDLLDSWTNLHVPRLTRSAIKGRRLFPVSDSKQSESESVDENEEAVTDIEEPVDSIEGTEIVHSEGLESTPGKRSLRSRTTRTHNADKSDPVHAAVSETKKRAKGGSPFDVWARKKPAKVSASKKREADPFIDSPAPVAKKAKAH
ncbi:conserved hypothetical protein [Talaromyces stipitatus ATCC 10500]|uniref:Uncharacterized protein n=1 Tax=Talaromyces stipitatus (strain ATCC 10500 / CBS 375.48 / QM 6759 / NRRL 1006) TaxID=441959 RepID=B8M7J0_TALSN|nr:uncharacterized protein TSTA_028320 [Talaromyces stipitatus ATCC 10500]EED19543.1 conserved hypothetical protein [Talaromyces stipitatus ATCC 10500]